MTTSTPSSSASSTRPNLSTLPPPDHGLQSSTGCRGRSTASGRRRSRSWRSRTSAARPHPTVAASRATSRTRRSNGPVPLGCRVGHREHEQRDARHHAGDADRPPGHPFGDQPPGTGAGDGKADQPDQQHVQVAGGHADQGQHEQRAEGEGRQRHGPLDPPDGWVALSSPPEEHASAGPDASPAIG